MQEQEIAPEERPDLRDADALLAVEIAEFVAARAQHFVDHECRAWALTDFGVWAALGGRSAKLSLEPAEPDQLLGRTTSSELL